MLVYVAITSSLNAMAWFLASRSRGAKSAPLLASLTTLLLPMVYTHVVVASTTDPNPTRTSFFLLLAITFLLVLRSSLIPSRTATTALDAICGGGDLHDRAADRAYAFSRLRRSETLAAASSSAVASSATRAEGAETEPSMR